MNNKKIVEIFSILKKQNPQPKTELAYNSPFELLISVMLSAQSTDISVNKATKNLFPVANTPEKITMLGEEGLKNYIKTIGLYNSKAKHIIQTCKILVEKFSSSIPSNRLGLESLPGVGRKTANVILNTVFKKPEIAIDTHIFRVANRTHMAIGKTPKIVEEKLLKIIPKKFLLDAHHWLVLHGRYTCIARRPLCEKCIIQDLCEYPDKKI